MTTAAEERSSLAAGFTLVELLVALLIMAVVSVMAFMAFDGILAMEQRSKHDFLAENRLQVASSIVLNDLFHLRARPVRDQLGGQLHAYLSPSNEYAVEFSRGGLPAFRAMRGGIQRVAYRVEDGNLVRVLWQVMDRGPATEVDSQILLTDVESIDFEQLSSEGRFVRNWPPLNQLIALDRLPAMVRFRMTMNDGDEYELKVPTPGESAEVTANSGLSE